MKNSVQVQYKKSVINKVIYRGRNIVRPWGLETADSDSFYSMEDKVGYRYKSLIFEDSIKDGVRVRKERVKAHDGEWVINLSESVEDAKISRKASLYALSDSFLMDFVIRYRFKKDLFPYALIGNNKIVHSSSNVYYQFDVKSACLVGDHCSVKITIDEFEGLESFKPTIYVRDSVEEWVVHVRLFPDNWDREVIKICSSWAKTKALPVPVTNLLMKSDIFRAETWYRGEKSPYNSRVVRRLFNINSFGLVKVCFGESLTLSSSMVILNK